MKLTHSILLSLLCSLSYSHHLEAHKKRLWIEGTKNLIPLLRTVFTNNRMLEGNELTGKITRLNKLIEQSEEKQLSDGEKEIVKKVESFAGYLQEVQACEQRGRAPSSQAARIKDRKLATIHVLCNQNKIVLRQGKKGKCLPRN